MYKYLRYKVNITTEVLRIGKGVEICLGLSGVNCVDWSRVRKISGRPPLRGDQGGDS